MLTCKHTPFLLELLFWTVSTDILRNVNLPMSQGLAVKWVASVMYSQHGISVPPHASSVTLGVSTLVPYVPMADTGMKLVLTWDVVRIQ